MAVAGAALALPVLVLVLGLGGAGGEGCPPCARGQEGQCQWLGAARDECFYRVGGVGGVGGGALTLQAAGAYFLLACPPSTSVDAPTLPRLEAPRAAPKAVLERCAPPALPYAAALRALGVTVLDELVLSRPPPAPALRADHLLGLQGLRRLALTAARGETLKAPAGLLEPLVGLRHLRLEGVRLAEEALLALPRGLQALHLAGCGLTELPQGMLARLTRLRTLVLDEPALLTPPALQEAPALRAVVVAAPLLTAPPLHTLHNATLGGNMLDVRLPTGCGALRQLNVLGVGAPDLPRGWLGAETCKTLAVLRLAGWRNLTLVQGGALEGADELVSLAITGCGRLHELPPDLLLPARRITSLDLSRNALRALPEGLLAPLTGLRELDVSHNQLGGGVAAMAGALPTLLVLRMGGNPLGDLCPVPTRPHLQATQLSALSPLGSLRELSLRASGVLRVCADWRRQLAALRQLDLRDNRVARLEDADWLWAPPVLVDLRGNPVGRVLLSRAQYHRLRRSAALAEGSVARLRLDAALPCDCSAYWLVRALKESLLPVTLEGATCSDGTSLEAVDPRALVCEERAQCSPGCRCRWRAHDDALLADCGDGGRTEPPRMVNASAARVELVLARNNISLVEPALLPKNTRRLDLAHNRLRTLDALLATLERGDLTLRLMGNPLACDCPRLVALHRYSALIEDFNNVTCESGEPVSSLRPEEQCGDGSDRSATGGMVAGAVALLGAVASGAVWGRRALRKRLKALLRARRYKHQEHHYTYDAFLAFSYHDVEAAEAVLAALEQDGSEEGLRLCVHFRDWTPGEWIPGAIERSVASSRRTLALVSDHFAASPWARAELRQASARAALGLGAPPLVVLLGGKTPPALRHHCRGHRTLRYSDPRLFPELRRLLADPSPAVPAQDYPDAALHSNSEKG